MHLSLHHGPYAYACLDACASDLPHRLCHTTSLSLYLPQTSSRLLPPPSTTAPAHHPPHLQGHCPIENTFYIFYTSWLARPWRGPARPFIDADRDRYGSDSAVCMCVRVREFVGGLQPSPSVIAAVPHPHPRNTAPEPARCKCYQRQGVGFVVSGSRFSQVCANVAASGFRTPEPTRWHVCAETLPPSWSE